jgi:hypothetical protein
MSISCWETDAEKIRDELMATEDKEDFDRAVIALANIIDSMSNDIAAIKLSTDRAANIASCLANGIQPD